MIMINEAYLVSDARPKLVKRSFYVLVKRGQMGRGTKTRAMFRSSDARVLDYVFRQHSNPLSRMHFRPRIFMRRSSRRYGGGFSGCGFVQQLVGRRSIQHFTPGFISQYANCRGDPGYTTVINARGGLTLELVPTF